MIYQLKYPNKETAMADLLAKGVYVNTKNLQDEEVLSYGNNIQAIVEIGLIVDTPAVMEDMEIVTEAIYFDGYHFDVMTEEVLEFDYIVTPKNPNHKFL